MKNERFKALAEDVCRCHICENLVTLPHLKNSEKLINDDHGLNDKQPYVNRWNLWQGDLNADIMVIGQDYGQMEDDPNFNRSIGDDSNPTDKKLKQLFQTCFNFDLDSKTAPLFFTNMANCYRVQRTSGGMHSGWLPLCANKFMARLIRIIRPKIIIVLGRVAFEAFYCMDGLPLICLDAAEKGKESFDEIIQHRYRLDLDGENIDVFPVFHPGSNSQINRTFDRQLEDWKKIAEHYKKVK